MTSKQGRAMIGHQSDGKCTAGFTDQFAFTHIEVFTSEKDARTWIAGEANRHGISEADITWIIGAPNT